MNQMSTHPEPVSSATQLALLPFLSAIDGYLKSSGEVAGLKTTLHRTMARDGLGYLQQACGYIPLTQGWQQKAGRLFPVTEGIIGAAYSNRTVWRTKYFATESELISELTHSRKVTDDEKPIEVVGLSYLAVPFLGTGGSVVLILYSECKTLNFFAENSRVKAVVEMCRSFCSTFDVLNREPFSYLRNFPLQAGVPVTAKPTVFPTLQEGMSIEPPKFTTVGAFNYEASVA